MLKRFTKAFFCLTAIWFSSHAAGQAQIVVNPDGSHSVVAGKVVINPNGTHSVITGNIVVNPNGTHSVLVGNAPASSDHANTLLQDGSHNKNTSYMRHEKLGNRSVTWVLTLGCNLKTKESVKVGTL